MNYRLLIPRERPAKDIQIFATSMENLKQAAAATLSNLPSGVMAILYQTKEERVGVVRAERVDGKVRLVAIQEEEKVNENSK